jgi:PAS domain S-box-containing protein
MVMPGPPEDIFESAYEAFVSMDAEGRIVRWNAAAEEMFGYDRGDALGMTVAEAIVPPQQRAAHREALRRFLATGEGRLLDRPLEFQACRRDGSTLPVRLTVTAQRDGANGWLFHAFVQDLTERAVLLAELEASLRERGPGFAEILDVLGEAVTIRDRADHIIYANRAALEHMGFSSLAELQTRPPGSIMDDYIVEREDGSALTMADIPSVRLLRGEEPEPLLMRTVHRSTGALTWNLLKASPLVDDAGEIVATATIIENVTAVKTSEVRGRFLAEASRVLGSSMDYAQTLRNVAWAAVPQIADWCAVDLVDIDGARQQVVAAHRDPGKLTLAEQLRAREPARMDPRQGLGRVVRSGESQLYPVVTEEMLAPAARDAEHLRLLREIGMRSVLIVALRTATRIFGAMTLVNAESGRTFDEDDLRFAEQLADRAAVAIENARLYEARSRTAATLQRSLLPDSVPKIPGWEVAALYRAAGADPELEVGGDFYDFLQTPEGWITIIGDVTGKGVEAASLTSLLRHGARFIGQGDARPATILRRLDLALDRHGPLSLCTTLCVALSADGVVFSSAGHPMPLLVSPSGAVREVGEPGRLLGLAQPYEWRDQVLDIEPGETIVLYTDGVTDTRGARQRFGEERLRDLLTRAAGCAPRQLLACLDRELADFQVGAQADDTAVIAMRLEPAPQPAAAGASRLVDERQRVGDAGELEHALDGRSAANQPQAVGVGARADVRGEHQPDAGRVHERQL